MPLQIESVAPVSPLRRAVLKVAPEIMLSVFQEMASGRQLTVKGIPADARVTATRFDENTGLILLRLESAEFKEIPLGEISPELDVVFSVR